MKRLLFSLEISDDWPPVSVEGIPYTLYKKGYKIDAAPLFIKDLSVDDVINVEFDSEGHVLKWESIKESNRSTIWLLRIAKTDDIDNVLKELRGLDCNTVELPQFGCYSIDIPEECSIDAVDKSLSQLDESCVAIAYPSFRHPD